MRINELEQYIGKTPELHYIPTYDPKPETDWYGIKALWYDGPAYKGQKTKVFAYIGYPQTKSQEKVPAVVLVHGGGGHAYGEWIRRWNEKGFAAIAMELCGYLPDRQWIGLLGTEENKDPRYVRQNRWRVVFFHYAPCKLGAIIYPPVQFFAQGD